MRIKKTFQGNLPENTVVNTRSDSQNNAYSCKYANEHFGGVVLYDNTSGSNGSITLSDNSANYSFIEIWVGGNYDTREIKKYPVSQNMHIPIYLFWQYEATGIQCEYKTYTLTGNKINQLYSNSAFQNNSSNYGAVGTQNSIKIFKVVGYK